MNKLLLLLVLIGLVSCQPKDQPSDVAARASGAYAVRSFVVDGDTLYSTSGRALRVDIELEKEMVNQQSNYCVVH